MKKIFKFLTPLIIALICTTLTSVGVTSEKVYAGTAPKLTQFKIMGLSNSGYYGTQRRYIPKQYISEKSRFEGPSVYIVTTQQGYGNISYSIDGGSYHRGKDIEKFPHIGSNNIVTGWTSVEELSDLTPGTHTIKAMCDSTVGFNRIYDSITFTIY